MNHNVSNTHFEPEIIVLYCQHSVNKEVDLTAAVKGVSGYHPRLVEMPCSSKIQVPHLFRILERGTDGIVVIACPEKECRFLVGNVRAGKRIKYARELLNQADIGADRLTMAHGKGMSAEEILAIVDHKANAVYHLGPNPMKGVNAK
jgi:F420-non-reducing hydrogenase iron-sulfur subunit